MDHNYVLSEVYTFFMVFCRVGTMMMLVPGFGERMIPAQIRIFSALGLSLVLHPILQPLIPSLPRAPAALAIYMILEVFIGVFIGLLARLLMSALEIAGNIAGFTSGLSSAQVLNPVYGNQESIISTFFTLGGITLILSTDLYVVFFQGILQSYKLFQPIHWINLGDISHTITQAVNRAFIVGIQLSFPFMIVGLIFYASIGLINRLMPQLQILFIGMPLQILLGFFTAFIVIKSVILKFATIFLEDIMHYLGMV